MALPQCAMAHFGSRVEASAKAFSDSVYWNECRRARPFSSEGCASRAQLVGKSTFPRWSEETTPPERSARASEGPTRRPESKSAEANNRSWRMANPPLDKRHSNSRCGACRVNPFDFGTASRLDAASARRLQWERSGTSKQV